METPGGGADFLDRGLLDGVARGEVQHVLADEFVEAFAGLVFEDGGFGEQVERARIHGGAGVGVLGFGAAGACSVGAGGGLLSGRSHMKWDRLVCPQGTH